MMGWRRNGGPWWPLVAVLCGLSGLFLFGVPHLGDAQDASAQELAAAQRALLEQEQLAAALQAQVAALPDLPVATLSLVRGIEPLLRAQQQALANGTPQAAQAPRAQAAAQLRRIGRAVRQHLAPPDEAALDARGASERLVRMQARADKLAALAADTGIEVAEAADLDAARAVVEGAVRDPSPGSERAAKQALQDYQATIDQLEDALLDRAGRTSSGASTGEVAP